MNLEVKEQETLFQWANLQRGRWPELRLMYHIPNGGQRDKAEAARFKAAGVKAGVPDICLPVARGKYHGLYIELKVGRNKPTDAQKTWIDALTKEGYCAVVCTGPWNVAASVIERYLKGETKQ